MGGLAGIVVLIGLLWRYGLRAANTQQILVLEYQRGVKFTDGKFTTVLEPGQHRTHRKKGRVDIVDMRPQPFIFEDITCEDKFGGRVVLSLAGEFAVNDPRLSLMSNREDGDDGTARVSKVTRDTVSNLAVPDTTDATLALIHSKLFEMLNQELRTIGLEIKNIALTELWTTTTKATSQEFNR